jgi:thiamine-monophosphate kinase
MTTEFSLIQWIRGRAGTPRSLLMNIGDDAAVFDPSFASSLAVTTDLLLEDVHFHRSWTSPRFLGKKAVAVNVSDLAAMGVKPYACLLALALPENCTGPFFQELMQGFFESCSRWGMPLIGGDLSRSSKVMLSVTAFGYGEEGTAAYRSSGLPGDTVCLIGNVGLSRMGLEYIHQSSRTGLAEVSSDEALLHWAGNQNIFECLKAHLLPVPKIREGVWLREKGLVHAMIDISDGLAADLLHIARESGCSLELDADRIPIPAAAGRELAAVTGHFPELLDYALNGGEDYALAFTLSTDQMTQLADNYPSGFQAFQPIGRLKAGQPGLFLRTGGETRAYQPRGFDHFQ